MTASILVCEYIKHGMMCELSGSLASYTLAWGAVSAIVTLAIVAFMAGRR